MSCGHHSGYSRTVVQVKVHVDVLWVRFHHPFASLSRATLNHLLALCPEEVTPASSVWLGILVVYYTMVRRTSSSVPPPMPGDDDANVPLIEYNMRGEDRMRALLIVQAFPPLLKNAGGVAKRYLTLCRALIDGLGWHVTLVTPVNILRAKDPDIQRWMADGDLMHIPARGVRADTVDGTGVMLDLFSVVNAFWLLHCLQQVRCAAGCGLRSIPAAGAPLPASPCTHAHARAFSLYLFLVCATRPPRCNAPSESYFPAVLVACALDCAACSSTKGSTFA